MTKTLHTLISDQKKETSIEECVSQARKLQAAADPSAALSRIEEGLSVYPREPRLIQIQESVQRDLQTQRRQFRRRDLEELRRMETEIDAAANPASKEALAARVRAVTAKYSTDGEVLSVANGLLHRLGLLEGAQTSSSESPKTGSPEIGSPKIGSPTSESATLTYHTPPAGAREPSPPAMSQAPKSNVPKSDIPLSNPPSNAPPKHLQATPPASEAVASAVGPLPPPAPPISPTQVVVDSADEVPAPAAKVASSLTTLKPRSKSTTLIIVSTAAAILVAAILLFLFGRKHREPSVAQAPEPAPVASSPAVSAPPALAPAEPTPSPTLPSLKLSSDTGVGKVTLDDQPPADLQDGQWSLDSLAAGEHKFKFKAPQGEASFTFSTAAGAVPVVTGSVVSKGILALVLTGMSGHLRIYSSDTATRVSLDGQAPLSVSKDGLDFPSISPGSHELAVTQGSDQYKLDVDSGAAPTLSAFLESGQNLGSLLIVAGQDKAKVFLNGNPLRQLTQGGQLRIPNLELKDYVVQVSKSGFQDAPQQTIRIRKGGQAKLIFNLQPVPHLASLNIQG
ncbi:MAG TPA: hypothetical protein VFF64_19950 [Candidatus Eremiobacteraceae bacterium]|nr:hypothetical protein [Candidatus Eremiobacteraceae bacterium]